jgi:hypothetical protein
VGGRCAVEKKSEVSGCERERRVEKGRRWRRREMGTGTVMGDEHEAVKGREGNE